jgi:hypothetical protein
MFSPGTDAARDRERSNRLYFDGGTEESATVLMALTISIMIGATIVVAAMMLAPRVAEGRLIFDQRPDTPRSFGYKMAWLAIRTRDPERVVEALRLTDVQRANWRTGLGTVYSERYGESFIFVSPPVNGWTFVVGLPLPHPLGRSFADKSTPLIRELGAEFIEVHYYFSYPPIDYYAWARVVDGKLIRAFAIGDEGVLWNEGKPSKEEKALGLKLFELRGVRERSGDAGGELVLYPTEEHVMHLASKWSLDPTRLETLPLTPALGFIGTAPRHWRAERLRRAA